MNNKGRAIEIEIEIRMKDKKKKSHKVPWTPGN